MSKMPDIWSYSKEVLDNDKEGVDWYNRLAL